MAGGYYTALSGMRVRLDALDRLAADIANASTSGYKTERAGTREAPRPSFRAALQSAVDVANGEARLDLRTGPIATTGRTLDVAIQGSGFFEIETPNGPRYTRNGHLVTANGVLASDDGYAFAGTDGPIKVGTGSIEIDSDGTVRTESGVAGRLKIVEFDDLSQIVRERGSTFRAERDPKAVEHPSIAVGALEQSNVSVVDRIAELSEVSRSFELLLRSVSLLMNDVDRSAVIELGRRS